MVFTNLQNILFIRISFLCYKNIFPFMCMCLPVSIYLNTFFSLSVCVGFLFFWRWLCKRTHSINRCWKHFWFERKRVKTYFSWHIMFQWSFFCSFSLLPIFSFSLDKNFKFISNFSHNHGHCFHPRTHENNTNNNRKKTKHWEFSVRFQTSEP